MGCSQFSSVPKHSSPFQGLVSGSFNEQPEVGRMGKFLAVPPAHTAVPQLPPGRFRQRMAKMCEISQVGLLKHMWTFFYCQKNLFLLSDVLLPSPRGHLRVCSPALSSSLCLRAPTALVLMPFFSCSPAHCPSPVTPGVPALSFDSLSPPFSRFLVAQFTCGGREGE